MYNIKIEYKNTILICELNYILYQILNNKLSCVSQLHIKCIPFVHNYIPNKYQS